MTLWHENASHSVHKQFWYQAAKEKHQNELINFIVALRHCAAIQYNGKKKKKTENVCKIV